MTAPGASLRKSVRLLQGMGMTPDEWAPSLLRLLEIQAGTEELAGVSPETLKAKTFEALRQICLHRSQQHPLDPRRGRSALDRPHLGSVLGATG